MSMRAGNDLVSSDIGNDADRIAVGKDIRQANQDVTVNIAHDVDNLAVNIDFLRADVEELRVEFATLNQKYTEAMVNDTKLSLALGILVIIMMVVLYWFGGIVLTLHDDMIRLTAQVQRIQSSGQTQEAISR